MNLSDFLCPSDARRANRTWKKLRLHGIERLVLTGGLAIEVHMQRRGIPLEPRPLNDIDLLAECFDDIPRSLSADFLFRHVHPHDPPGKTLLQCVDPEAAVRVDVFRARGKSMGRATPAEFSGADVRIVCLEDLAAYTARLCMDLATDVPVPAKHAKDFLRLLPLVESSRVELSWLEQRKPGHPDSFRAAAHLLKGLIGARKELQIIPTGSQDVLATCRRCEALEEFPLASAGDILPLLGYC